MSRWSAWCGWTWTIARLILNWNPSSPVAQKGTKLPRPVATAKPQRKRKVQKNRSAAHLQPRHKRPGQNGLNVERRAPWLVPVRKNPQQARRSQRQVKLHAVKPEAAVRIEE